MNLFDITRAIEAPLGKRPRKANDSEVAAYMLWKRERLGLPDMSKTELRFCEHRNGRKYERGHCIGATFGNQLERGTWENGAYSIIMPGHDAHRARVTMETLDDAGEVLASQTLPVEPKKCGVIWTRDDVRKAAGPIAKPAKGKAAPAMPQISGQERAGEAKEPCAALDGGEAPDALCGRYSAGERVVALGLDLARATPDKSVDPTVDNPELMHARVTIGLGEGHVMAAIAANEVTELAFHVDKQDITTCSFPSDYIDGTGCADISEHVETFGLEPSAGEQFANCAFISDGNGVSGHKFHGRSSIAMVDRGGVGLLPDLVPPSDSESPESSQARPAAPIAEPTPEPNDMAALVARIEALEATISRMETVAPLSAEAGPAPTVAKRTPAHERAIRRAWAMRAEARSQRAAARDAAKWCNHWAREHREAQNALRERDSWLVAKQELLDTMHENYTALNRFTDSETLRANENARLITRRNKQRRRVLGLALELRRRGALDRSALAAASDYARKLERERDFERARADTLHAQLAKIAADTADYRERARPGVSRLLAGGSAVALRAVA